MDLTNPWLVAAWPGMGGVAMIAVKHMIHALEPEKVASRIAPVSNDFNHVHVKGGVMEPTRPIETRMHVWRDPRGIRDLVIVDANSQPPEGELWSYGLALAKEARRLGVVRVVTFAAIAAPITPKAPSVVVAAVAPDDGLLAELRSMGVKPIEDMPIMGMNGLAVAALGAAGIPGACLMATMPHFAQGVPNPKASLALLEAFATFSGIDMNMEELREHSVHMEEALSEMHEQALRAGHLHEGDDDEEEEEEEGEVARTGPAPHDRLKIERMFADAESDRGAAMRLKAELDRLGAFREYEDRFLDLFRHGGS